MSPKRKKIPREKVVYVLGAGFSACFGLPVISTFLKEANRQRRDGDLDASLHEEVFAAFTRLNAVKNHYKAEMTNIEEVLSILQIESLVNGRDFGLMKRFVCEVIQNATPEFERFPGNFQPDWRRNAFGTDSSLSPLGLFVAGLHHEVIERVDSHLERSSSITVPKSYSVITTNYDLLLENAAAFVGQSIAGSSDLVFRRRQGDRPDAPLLAKLHGCVSTGDIIPPTSIKDPSRHADGPWKFALEALQQAQHVRFVGYSLQEADATVRYLFKAAAIEADQYETIDVICLDETQEVRTRFENFFARPVRFAAMSFGDLLTRMHVQFTQNADGTGEQPSPAECLEAAHSYLMWSIGSGNPSKKAAV